MSRLPTETQPALNAEVDDWRVGRKPERVPHGSLPWLVRLCRADPRYINKAPKTQRFYDEGTKRLERWSHNAGDPPS